MSAEWRQKLFNKDICQGVVLNEGNGDITVSGTVKSNTSNPVVVFWAPNPPTYSTSYSGSGLPYPNPDVAYNKTPNTGAVRAIDRKFTFKIKYPNAYYIGLGSLYVPPSVHIKVCEPGMDDKFFSLKVDEGIPYRTLTYPAPPSKKPRDGPMFYSSEPQEVRSQETILRQSGYPTTNEMPDNFWGLKPPC